MINQNRGSESKEVKTTTIDYKQESAPIPILSKNEKVMQELLYPGRDDFIFTLQAASQNALRETMKPGFNFNLFYSSVESSILRHIDYLDGIVSSVIYDSEKYPTGIAFYRDATQAIPLAERLPPNHPRIEAQNMLLRALNTMRGIDHVLMVNGFNADRVELLKSFSHLIITVLDISTEKSIKSLHKAFNTSLIRILHKNNLDNGLSSAKEYNSLLCHYRDLASTLDPAKSIVTVTQDNTPYNKKHIDVTRTIHTETAHPITVKTSEQKSQLQAMKIIAPPVSASEKSTFHTVKKIGFQIAEAAFADLIARDDRRLPAQTRKTIGPTVKNAYLVHNEVSFEDLDPKSKQVEVVSKKEFWSLRCGSPVFVGKGESPQKLERYVLDIITQLKTAAEKTGRKQLNFTMLVTDASSEHQDVIIETCKRAFKKTGCTWAHAPNNFQGQFQPITVSETSTIDLSSGRDLLAKANRINKAAEIVLHYSQTFTNDINVTFCASGQDRTGTVQETATQVWAAQQYELIGMIATRQHIEKVRAVGYHNAFLASFATPGSLGMKNDSRAWDHFLDETNKYFYRATAETNKKTPISKDDLEKITGTPFIKTTHHVEEKKADKNNYRGFVAHVSIMRIGYKGLTHTSMLEKLEKEIKTIAVDSLLSPTDKLEKMISHTQTTIWKPAVQKYSHGKVASTPNDQLIEILNRERENHSTLRNIGNLLQNYTRLSETGQKIFPETPVFHRVPKTFITNLMSDIKALTNILKGPAELTDILTKLTKVQDDAGYTKAVIDLNTLWVTMVNRHASIFDLRQSILVKNNKLMNKLNINPNQSEFVFERGIATILQKISSHYPGVLYPAINHLTQPLMLEKTALKTPKSSLSS